ncbi:MAG TPA: UbiX family flavin prenyltransferase [Saprospiraceae bacterium]|nr:UbiX family flavin prenyltransferase [Lewinellaceae bacterium]HPK09471.1 UbiX family flavin prenyltransferase [Saprospiraceae bacterium]HRX27822.1 UbiX family flavin prenyltransferase [Saprospiraceae bacterium]
MEHRKTKIVIAVGGSSGSIYAKRLIEKLDIQKENVDLHLVFSKNAITNWELEIGKFDDKDFSFPIYKNNDFFAPFASGSAGFDAMIVCPCSMGLLGRMASGVSNDLITRSADVMLKERKKLILVARETPLNLIHIDNMKAMTLAGAIICPASPSFYSKPETILDLVDTVVDRVLDLAGLPTHGTFRWGTKK